CFVCEANDNSIAIDAPRTCPVCPPNTPLNPKKGQPVLAHNAAHLLFDPAIRGTERCGMCLNPAPMCEYFMKKTGPPKIDISRSKCPSLAVKFTYSIAAKSVSASPCSNVPVNCAVCGVEDPAVWRYNYLHHLRHVHPVAPEEKYRSIWELSAAETTAMKAIWETREKGVPIPQKRAPKTAPLVISEAHSSRLSMR
ncbi:hypothetical protein GGX14DRAFT_381116, partial [Mycena pura]